VFTQVVLTEELHLSLDECRQLAVLDLTEFSHIEAKGRRGLLEEHKEFAELYE